MHDVDGWAFKVYFVFLMVLPTIHGIPKYSPIPSATEIGRKSASIFGVQYREEKL